MARKIVLVGAITFFFASVESLQYTKIVQTTSGPVRGAEVVSDGIQFKAFKGIPYAKAPVGELRFKAPQPPERWTAVRSTTEFGPICHQPVLMVARTHLNIPLMVRTFFSNARNMIEILVRLLQTSEDCLSLNVYTTQLGDKGFKPVLVFIHGGGFVLGDGTDTVYGPEFLIQRDIVVVTINYRIGTLGFLSTNTTETPGNWGLKDQVAALKWIRDNIARFGGDPKQVTIYGQSAGATSAHFHLLSPASEGLFHRAIIASGAVTCPWAVNDQQERLSRRLAIMVGASATEADDPNNRVKFLRKIDGKMLSDKFLDIHDEEMVNAGTEVPTSIVFSPVIEPPETIGAFLTEDPNKLIAEGRFTKVPLMMGTTDLEGGIIFTGASKFHTLNDTRRAVTDACKILPTSLRRAVRVKDACPKVTKELSDFYFGGKPFNSSALNFVHMCGDLLIRHGVHEAQKWHARYSNKESPAYFYYYTYDGEWKMFKNFFNLKLPGAFHGGDMDYIFKSKLFLLPRLSSTSSGHYNQERILVFLSNFVKYGTPTPTLSKTTPISWEPASGEELNTMHISTNLKMEKSAVADRMAFWDNLYKKYIGTSIHE